MGEITGASDLGNVGATETGELETEVEFAAGAVGTTGGTMFDALGKVAVTGGSGMPVGTELSEGNVLAGAEGIEGRGDVGTGGGVTDAKMEGGATGDGSFEVSGFGAGGCGVVAAVPVTGGGGTTGATSVFALIGGGGRGGGAAGVIGMTGDLAITGGGMTGVPSSGCVTVCGEDAVLGMSIKRSEPVGFFGRADCGRAGGGTTGEEIGGCGVTGTGAATGAENVGGRGGALGLGGSGLDLATRGRG